MPGRDTDGLDPAALRAVFFDLDDTLLDTAGQLVGPALDEAAARMIEAGLTVEHGRLYGWLRRRAAEGRGGDYFEDAVGFFDAPEELRDRLVAAGRRAYFEREIPPIEPFPGTRTLLSVLRRRLLVFLVTAGDPATQRRKLHGLGLEDAFDGVRWVDSMAGESKRVAFEELTEEHGLEPERCLVVGDRIEGEIADGNELGMWTVRIRRGEFSRMEPSTPAEEPDLVVADLDELARLLEIDPADGGGARQPSGGADDEG